jgi:hypothetical protein
MQSIDFEFRTKYLKITSKLDSQQTPSISNNYISPTKSLMKLNFFVKML